VKLLEAYGLWDKKKRLDFVRDLDPNMRNFVTYV